MTMPDERYRAVKGTQEFLRELLDRKATPRVPKDIRRRARSLLKHYPSEPYTILASYTWTWRQKRHQRFFVKHSFQVGDKIAYYMWGNRFVCYVTKVEGDVLGISHQEKDRANLDGVAHVKQCRRLIKKIRSSEPKAQA